MSKKLTASGASLCARQSREQSLVAGRQDPTTAGPSIAVKGEQARPVERGDILASWITGWQVWDSTEMALYVECDERERAIIRGLKGIR